MNKSVADDFGDSVNPLVNTNILRGEQNLLDDRDQRYPAIEKVTLSGSLQTKLRTLTVTEGRC